MKKVLFSVAFGLCMFTTASAEATTTSSEEVLFDSCFDRALRIERAFCGGTLCNFDLFAAVIDDCVANG